MTLMTIDSILEFMRTHDYESDIQHDTQQVYTILKIEQKEYPLFLRIFDDGHLLQMLAFIPSHLTPNDTLMQGKSSKKDNPVIGEMARLLHLLNKELDVPGFGMDEMAGVVFYRLMLPTPKKKIDRELLLAFLKTVEHVCQMFSNPIEAVSTGQMTLDQILTKAQEMGAQS